MHGVTSSEYIVFTVSLALDFVILLISTTGISVCLTIEFHGFTSRIKSKGYHCLVPGLISIFVVTVWVPLNI